MHVDYSSENIIVKFEEKTIEGTVRITLTNTGSTTINQITLVTWPLAYQRGQQTNLAIELLEDQNARMHFANEEDLGSVSVVFNPINDGFDEVEGSEIIHPLAFEEEVYAIDLQPGAKMAFRYSFRYQLPNARFNGYGFNENTIRLSHWLPRIAQTTDSTTQITYNSRNRDAWFVPATYDLTITVNAPVDLASNLHISEMGGDDIKNYHLTATAPQYDALLIFQRNGLALEVPETTPSVTLHLGQNTPQFKTNSSWTRIIDFLQKEINLAPQAHHNIVFLGDKNGLQSAGNCILIDNWQTQDDLEGELVEELVLIFAREQMGINPAEQPHLVMGLANYYKHVFYARFYPDKMLLGPLSKTVLARFF